MHEGGIKRETEEVFFGENDDSCELVIVGLYIYIYITPTAGVCRSMMAVMYCSCDFKQ